MNAIIVDGTISVLSKAIKNFANEDKTAIVRPSAVKIIISISDITVEEGTELNPVKRTQGEPFYRIIKNDKPYLRPRKIKVHPGQAMTDEVSFLQVLGSKVDFFQIEMQSKQYLIDAFVRFAAELNKQTLEDEGFKEFIKAEQAKIKVEEDKNLYEAFLQSEKDMIIADNTIYPTDLEIMVVTPQRETLNKKGEVDEPIEPVPFLYVKGEFIKQLTFSKDIFQMIE